MELKQSNDDFSKKLNKTKTINRIIQYKDKDRRYKDEIIIDTVIGISSSDIFIKINIDRFRSFSR